MTQELLKVHGQEEKQRVQLKYSREQRWVEEEGSDCNVENMLKLDNSINCSCSPFV
jgi:hypothetical protein